jgi:hypothetical protein
MEIGSYPYRGSDLACRLFVTQGMNRHRLRAQYLWAGVLILGCAVGAQTKNEPWVQKDWAQWSAADCELVLNKSPWVHVADASLPRAFSDAEDKWTIQQLTIRLISALPVRQALLRELQLKNHYDGMNPQEKLKFDQEYAKNYDLSEGDNDHIEIEIVRSRRMPPNTVSDQSPVAGSPGGSPIALQLSDGTLVLPTRTTVVENDLTVNRCRYVFPRDVRGRPLYTAYDSSLQIDIGEHHLGTLERTGDVAPGPFRRLPSGENYSFKISDLMYKGQLEY